ncbi:hypothetical protein GCM10020331_010390 [Ectobacillus funiculus]
MDDYYTNSAVQEANAKQKELKRTEYAVSIKHRRTNPIRETENEDRKKAKTDQVKENQAVLRQRKTFVSP